MKALEKLKRSARKRRKKIAKLFEVLLRTTRRWLRGLRRSLRKGAAGVRVRWVNLIRSLYESVGIGIWSRMALDDIDVRLERYLPQRGGYFVEAGANDGVTFSNTYYFEKIKGWQGVLVEPVPELAARCKSRRVRSRVVNAALVAPDFQSEIIRISHANLMSVVEGAYGDQKRAEEHASLGQTIQRMDEIKEFDVPARTLSSILEEYGAPVGFDLLSLDVEGYEVQALRGLDIERFRPGFVCIETEDPALIAQLLGDRYVLVEKLTVHDYLFQRLRPVGY